ncbi:BNR repeat-containing protein [Micromonospora sp. NPDC085948]|uniref:BNR repeat-containing protein n=1 Tax=Micromonospora sp. NPDC085948 TaxID=3155293 RepID=UPI003447209A
MTALHHYRAGSALAGLLLIVTTSSAASAASPTVNTPATTTLTTQGRTAESYTGLMNGESFQQDGIVSHRRWQYAAFWDQQGYVNVSRRPTNGTWQTIRLTDYRTTTTDSHNVISIGLSHVDGSVHLSFDMHSQRFRYRKSVAGIATSPDTATWSPAIFGAVQNNLAGRDMAVMTYPQFTTMPDGNLQLTIRTGESGNGNQVLFEYRAGAWAFVGKIMNGTTLGNNAYLFGFQYDGQGVLHMTWTVRETFDASTNHDLYYAYSTDRGRTWRSGSGALIGTADSSPISTTTTVARFWAIGQNRGLMNQESQTVDSAGNVHVLASHLPPSAPSDAVFSNARTSAVLVHYWREAATGQWRQRILGYQAGVSRGDIGVDSRDNLFVVSAASNTGVLQIATASRASGWSDWAVRYRSTATFTSDPLLDHRLLKSNNIASVFAPHQGGSRIDVLNFSSAGN